MCSAVSIAKLKMSNRRSPVVHRAPRRTAHRRDRALPQHMSARLKAVQITWIYSIRRIDIMQRSPQSKEYVTYYGKLHVLR